MPSRAGTIQRRGIVGVREDLSDVIANVDPTGFVALQNLSTGPAISQTFYEWQTDEDRDGDKDNRVPEGNVSSFRRPTTTKRLGNYTQISEDTLSVSGTTEAINRIAGRGGRESTYQMVKIMRQLQRDMELSFWRNEGGTASANAVNEGIAALEGENADDAVDDTRRTAGVRSFVKTNLSSSGTNRGNTSRTTSGAVPEAGPMVGTWSNYPMVRNGAWVVNASASGTAANDLTLGTPTEATLRTLLSSMYDVNETDGYNLIVGAGVKVTMSGFDGITEKTHNVSGTTKPIINDSIDVYQGDFHTLSIEPSRHIWPVDGFLMDWGKLNIRYLRPMGTTNLGVRGDSREWLINVEYGFAGNNEKSLGAFTDMSPVVSRA